MRRRDRDCSIYSKGFRKIVANVGFVFGLGIMVATPWTGFDASTVLLIILTVVVVWLTIYSLFGFFFWR